MTLSEHEGVIRYRRAQSVTRAEEIQAVELKLRKSQPDHPVHKPKDSLLSWTSGFNHFTGFINWAFLLLSISGIRLLLENFIKYGIRVDPIQWFYTFTGQDGSGSQHLSLILIAYSGLPAMFCLLTEKALSIDIISNSLGMAIHITNLALLVLVPMIVIHVQDGFSLIGASSVTSLYSILFLKLWSYVQVNMWCRSARFHRCTHKSNITRRQSLSFTSSGKSSLEQPSGSSSCSSSNDKNSDEDCAPLFSSHMRPSESTTSTAHQLLVQYPDNLNVKDLCYFLFAPTLCYELNFPRTERIRKRFLMKRIFEVFAGIQIILCVLQQYMIPSVKNSLMPFSNMDIAVASERLLKLAIPNHLAWLCLFYIVFHSWLNLVGEVLQFADRNFYSDWWNANNIDTFWRSWNLPVHRWALRHLYFPLINLGYSKNVGSTTVFFISAFFHEYMVSVPLKTYKIWAFMGMMSQIPLSHLSKYMERKYGPRWGNLIVWASLIIGQPLCIMMYYHDYVVTRFGQSLLEDYGHV